MATEVNNIYFYRMIAETTECLSAFADIMNFGGPVGGSNELFSFDEKANECFVL